MVGYSGDTTQTKKRKYENMREQGMKLLLKNNMCGTYEGYRLVVPCEQLHRTSKLTTNGRARFNSDWRSVFILAIAFTFVIIIISLVLFILLLLPTKPFLRPSI